MNLNEVKRCIKRLTGYKYYPNCSPSAVIDGKVKVYNKDNLVMGEHSHIGFNSTIMNKYARFIIKKYSGTSINFTVVTGNHPMIVGRFYRTISKVRDKLDISLYDKDVVVDEDVWIGCNVILLSGVHIGRGCCIGAGAVVTRSMPPYCVVGGVPAKPIKIKWTVDEILEHESKLYPENERFSREELEQILSNIKH